MSYKRLKEHFKNILKQIFKNIGPSSKISFEGKEMYKFEDDLYFNSDYFIWTMPIKLEILDKIPKYKGKVNIQTSDELLEHICLNIYRKIKRRVETISDSLDIYLKEEDIDFGFKEIFKKMDISYGKHSVYFISNILVLKEIESINIGRVSIKRVGEKIVKELPTIIEKPLFSCVYTPMQIALMKGNYLDPNRFVKEFEGKTMFEITLEGYQVGNERSKIFERAIEEFKYVLSYLSICKTFLENVSSDKYSFSIEYIKLDNRSNSENKYQIYYVRDHNNTKILKCVRDFQGYLKLPKFTFIIDSELLEVIKKRCYLSNFCMIMENEKLGEVGNKIKLSLEWVFKEMIEYDDTDKVIALFISLETLITTGPDPFMSLTDDYAENVAIMTVTGIERRLEEKRFFKKVYKLRNNIMHNGYKIKWLDDWQKIKRLKIYIAWSLRYFINNINKIMKIGNDTNALKEYFERLKLK